MIIDLSGASGAAVLVAWLDTLRNVPAMAPPAVPVPPAVDMPPVLRQRLQAQSERDRPASYLSLALPEDLRAVTTMAADFLHCTADDGSNLCLWVVDGRWQDEQVRLISDEHRYLVVLTVQQGAPPLFQRDGPAGQERLQIGDRVIAVQDGRLRVVTPGEE